MRPRLRAEHRARSARGRCTVEFVGFRRPQHDPHRPAVQSRVSSASAPPHWLEAVRQVVAAVGASDVTELELRRGDFALRIRRQPVQSVETGGADDVHTSDGHVHAVLAPFTGVFYRSPTPTARAYVNEGDWIEADAVIGLVETMKIFNEVTTDQSGRLVRFGVDNGQLVQV